MTEKEQREHLRNSYRAGNSVPPSHGGKCPNPKDMRNKTTQKGIASVLEQI